MLFEEFINDYPIKINFLISESIHHDQKFRIIRVVIYPFN
jgi:hypothetical protein